jgi:hypothetical protein
MDIYRVRKVRKEHITRNIYIDNCINESVIDYNNLFSQLKIK